MRRDADAAGPSGLSYCVAPIDEAARSLRQEARETWDYLVTGPVVYSSHLGEAKTFARRGYLEQYVHSEIWFECTLRIAPLGQAYAARVIFEYLNSDLAKSLNCRDVLTPGKRGMDSMLIDVPKVIKDGEVMGGGIPTVGWLKFYNVWNGVRGDVIGTRPEFLDVPLAERFG